MQKSSVAIIGAGLGGLSAAISLKAAGYDVEIFEKNENIGGKLNVMKMEGFTFDLGPSIFTLPSMFEALFARAGKKMAFLLPFSQQLSWRSSHARARKWRITSS